MRILIALFFAAVYPLAAQTPEVPHKMEFAGITLTIRDDARREIQKDVDALTLSPKHYNIKVERARTYFPIIERVFAEEGLPDDFKYLALQESALIPDAVSVSNAVGFWQFKDFTAMEMGLRVDKSIDERLNIVSSSRAAARYIKKNNGFFNNWVFALQAYQMGAGGVLKSVDQSYSGATHMEITSQTYWYVKKYLAHKIAYEPAVAGRGSIELVSYPNSTGKSFSQLSKEVGVDESEIRDYNRWCRNGDVPSDRTYVVVIPVKSAQTISLPVVSPDTRVQPTASVASAKIQFVKKRINGVQAIQAGEGETVEALASRAEVSVAKFLKWNDMSKTDALVAGQFYFLGKKRGRAQQNFHKLVAGENLWSISQQYGVQLRKLRKFNRMDESQQVAVGTTLYLASTRPASTDAVVIDEAVAVDNGETFNWTAKSDSQLDPQSSILPSNTVQVSQTEPEITPRTSTVTNSPEPVIVIAPATEPDSTQMEPDPTTLTSTTDPIDTAISPSKTEHIVQAKETLYSIAKTYNVGVMDLVRWNNLDLQQGIKIGQVLKLTENQEVKEKEAMTTAERPAIHEVKASDTLYSIARQYGVTIKDLMDWNQKKDFSLSVGEKLKIQSSR